MHEHRVWMLLITAAVVSEDLLEMDGACARIHA